MNSSDELKMLRSIKMDTVKLLESHKIHYEVSTDIGKALNENLDRLINKLMDISTNKDMMPVSTLKWIVVFMIAFQLISSFGVEVLKEFPLKEFFSGGR